MIEKQLKKSILNSYAHQAQKEFSGFLTKTKSPFLKTRQNKTDIRYVITIKDNLRKILEY